MTARQTSIEYAEGVIAGAVPAGGLVVLACQRFLDDLARAPGDDWPYRFDEERADRACKFMQAMPHTKGRWAAKHERLVFQPWQVFIEANLFGWVSAESGLRRFRESYEEVPRKNGKSIRLAARGIYLFAADNESGAEVYSGATTEKQAHEVFRPAWQMVQKLPGLRDRFGIDQSGNPKNPGPMYVMEDMSKYEALVGKPGDGSSPHAALIDEYHEHDTDHMVDAMQTGMGSREQPLLCIITTAGSNMGGPCYEKRRDVCRILEGQVRDDRIFGYIAGIDDDDAWDNPASLVKANPNYGVSVFPEFLQAQLEQAKRSASKQNAFRTKHLNQWVGARTAWMNMLVWQRQRRAFDLEDFTGCPCWVGVDLASKLDVAAVVILFVKGAEYFVVPRFYVPESTLQQNEKYLDFVTGGHMVPTPGDMTDYEFIEAELLQLSRVAEIRDVAFDPAQAAYLMTRLGKSGLPVIEMAQSVKNLSEPMKEVEALTVSRRLWHDGNPAMTWMIGNVVARVDAKEHIYPRKETPADKIDGPVALIMAMGRAMLQNDDAGNFDEYLRNPLGLA